MQSFPWQSLLDWYRTNGRYDLPWRSYFHLSAKDLGYHIWLSEILLQQTQVSRGIGYYERILARFPTIDSLTASDYEEFFEYYKGLGYYSRARNMLKTAKIVTKEYNWIFPNDRMKLESLPGVGPYTAAAIQSFAYDKSVLSFDTNLQKIFARYYHGDRFAKLSKTEKWAIEADFLASGLSGREMNAALMDFASLVSVNNNSGVDWNSYPLQNCKFYETRGSLEPDREKKRIVFPVKDAQIIVTLHRDHKTYFSSSESEYLPFTLAPTEWDIRHFVQSYFRNRYGLEVSVRPVHEKYYDKGNRPFVECRAQVQKGVIPFRRYEKKEISALL